MTNDIGSVDGSLVQNLDMLVGMGLGLIFDLFSAVFFVPIFSLPGLFITLVGWYLGNLYLNAQLIVKRHNRCVSPPHLTKSSSDPPRQQCEGTDAGSSWCSILRSRCVNRVPSRITLMVDACPVSIRAYGAQEVFQAEARNRIDEYVRISRLNYDLNRWIGIRIDLLGTLFTVLLASYLTFFSDISAANVGFSLSKAVDFCSLILYLVRTFNMFQVEATR